MQIETLFEPGNIRGFMSSQNPLAIPKQYVALLQNTRVASGPIIARDGDANVNTNIAAGTVRGGICCSLNGTQYWFIAIGNGSTVSIYASTDNGVNWSNISPTSGAYGDTRLTDSSSTPVRFCVVKDRPFSGGAAYDLLVIQNGVNAPRIYGKGIAMDYSYQQPQSTAFTFAAYGMAVVTQPLKPESDGNLTAYTTLYNSFVVGNYTSISFVNGTGITAANSGTSTTSNYLTVTIASATYAVGNSCTITFPASIDASQTTQFILIGNCTGDTAWDSHLVVSLIDNSANEILLCDPSTTPMGYTSIESGSSSYYGRMIGYPLPSSTSTTFDWSHVKKIKLSYTEVPASDITINLYVASAGGATQGGANHAVSFYSVDTRQESPATVVTKVVPGVLADAGGAIQGFGMIAGNFNIPVDPRFYYDYKIYGSPPTTAQKNAGISHALLYRQEYGQDDYYYVRARQVCYWYNSTEWRYTQTSSTTRTFFYFPVGPTSLYNNIQDFGKPALDSNEICLQIGTATCSANSRLFSTGLLGGASSKLYYSRVDRPFAFREFIQFIDGDFVPNSGGSRTFDGEVIQAIVPIGSLAGSAESLGSPTVGTTTLMVLTDYNLYEMSGYDALSLNRATARGPYGTLSPYSVARSRLGIAWLSNSGQVMQYDGSLSFLGLNQVDNKTTTIPAARKVWAGGVYCNDVYRLLYTPTGGSANTKALCYDYRLVAWESEDTCTLGNPDLILAGKIGDVVGVLAFATSGGNVKCFRYEEPSNTNAVDFKVKFAELANSSNYMLLQAMGVQGTKTSGQTVTLTTTRATKGSTGGVASGTITVNDSSTFYWKWDDLGVGVEAGTIQPEISGSINGGVTLYRVFAEIGTGVKGVSR